MKCLNRPSFFLLLLFSSQSLIGALEAPSELTAPRIRAREAPPLENGATDDGTAATKTDFGTRDAPVDGKDGKPHAGPFVEVSSGKEKLAAVVQDIGPAKPTPTSLERYIKEVSKDGEAIPESNDGVMDDKNRFTPKAGTTGTEGGVSEKSRDRQAQEGQTGAKPEKVPDSPKGVPPLPHSEQEKILQVASGTNSDGTSSVVAEKPKGAQGLEKPTDLPDTPHDIPHPVPPTLPKNDDLGSPPSDGESVRSPLPGEDEGGIIQPFHSFILSVTMILFSEIGDKTFLVAALMAMRHPRLLVFSAAFSALIAMTVLSAVLGHAVPTLLPKRFTSFLAAVLFLVFGAKLLREGYYMSPNEGVGEEMKEVEMELEEKEHSSRKKGRRRSSISPYMLEAGRSRRARSGQRLPALARSPSSSPSPPRSSPSSAFSNALSGLNNLCSLLLSPAWVQTFVMTFLGEWGDRSQIATIAMAAGQDYWWVTGGAITGHALCTAVAVIGGRAVAGRVSMRVVTLGGAISFLAFGIIYFLEAMYSE